MEDATKELGMMVTELKPERNEKLRELLTKPFTQDQIQQRSGGKRGMFSYVNSALIKQRLNEAFDFQWSWDITDFKVQDNQCFVVGRLSAQIDGVTVSKMGFGGKTISGELGDDLKAAASDAIKVAASLFGIGLHMYTENKPQQTPPGPGYPPTQQQYPPRGYQQQAPPPQQYGPPQQPQYRPPQQPQYRPPAQPQYGAPQQPQQHPDVYMPPKDQWAQQQPPPPPSTYLPQGAPQHYPNANPPIPAQPPQTQPQMQAPPPVTTSTDIPVMPVINAPVNTESSVNDIDGIG